MGREVEQAKTEKGQWHAAKPQERAIGFKSADALEKQHRAL